MNHQIFQRTGRLALLLVVQIVFFNHIHIAGYITPIFIGYMTMCFPYGSSRISLLVWGFVTGLLFDIFSNTAGMCSAACTLLGMMQPVLLKHVMPRDAGEGFSPGIRSIGFAGYLAYAFFCMLVVNAVFYTLDAFMLHDWPFTLLSIGGSTLMAVLLCVCADMFRQKAKRG